MATPPYKGTGQPTANSGGFLGLGSLFSASAPSYASAPTTPAVSASSRSTSGSSADDFYRITLVIPRAMFGSQQLAANAVQDGAVSSCDAEPIVLEIPGSLIQPRQ
jgi:hypothetical protein